MATVPLNCFSTPIRRWARCLRLHSQRLFLVSSAGPRDTWRKNGLNGAREQSTAVAFPSNWSGSPSELPVEQLFTNKQVHSLLCKVAGRDLRKIFGHKPGKKLEKSEIRLLTDEELKQMTERKLEEVSYHMQPPPVLSARKNCERVISEEPLLDGHDESGIIFTDITYGVKERRRNIVVRQANGILRTATWQERDRMNQIYFPVEGREIHVPALFLEEHLQNALDNNMEEYILDRACIQFQPDDPHFIQVCRRVYDGLEKKRDFARLHSTRHMAGFVFYLVLNKRLENMLIFLLHNHRLDVCGDILALFYLIHPDMAAKRASLAAGDKLDPVDEMKAFISVCGHSKGNLELALQTYQEQLRQDQQSMPSTYVAAAQL